MMATSRTIKVAGGSVIANGNVTATQSARVNASNIARSSAVEAKVRNEIKDSFNNILRSHAKHGFKPEKSAAKAYQSVQRLREQLEAKLKDAEKKIKLLEKQNIDATSKVRIDAEKEIKALTSQITTLKKENNSAESKAKKLGKQVKELLRDKRSAKYSNVVPKITDTRSPDPNGK